MTLNLSRWWRRARQQLPVLRRQADAIPDGLWLHTLVRYPFLAALPLPEQQRLRALSAQFLSDKEFHGAHGLTITDEIALAIAAQACLPLVRLPGQGRWRDDALGWYDDFVTIVVHPAEAVAQRDLALALFDLLVDELDDLAGLHVDQVVVVVVGRFLVTAAAVAEVVTLDDAGILEQLDGPVDRGERD